MAVARPDSPVSPLDADHGYLFVTYVYQDEEGVLRNNITRFSTRPHSFSPAPSGRIDFTEVLKPYRSALSHQVGPCLVEGDDLYLGIGDGHEPLASQDPNTLLGKIARLTLDGRPADGNPFRRRGASVEAAAYVYALGLRNPFGLVRAHDRLFFTDNGILSDRLAELERGRNYLWDGTDWSIAAAADLVFPTPVAPATLVYLDSTAAFFPKDHRDRFYLAVAGSPWTRGRGGDLGKGIVTIGYDRLENRLTSRPRVFVRYAGSGHQAVMALAPGPNGLFFAPMLPNDRGRTPVFRISHAPGDPHPTAASERDPEVLMISKGCIGCHTRAGIGRNVGPSLDRADLLARIGSRLATREERELLRGLGATREHDRSVGRARLEEIRDLEGDAQARAWVAAWLEDPGFDGSPTGMPDPGLSTEEAVILARYLIPPDHGMPLLLLSGAYRQGVKWFWLRLGDARYRHVIAGVVIGMLAALAMVGAWRVMRRR
ncbi:MAG TPA: PQQ-dependent sugar dehydrogenase [Geminicoccaceae bacterium]